MIFFSKVFISLPLSGVKAEKKTNVDEFCWLKSLILRINDRGPYVGERILDCSYGAAKKLDFLTEGVTEVKIQIIEWGDNIYMHHKKD